MTTALKLRRGTTAQHSTFTGAEGEVTVDTTKDTVVVHDGATAGGFPLLKEANPSYTGTLTGGTGVVNIGSGQVYKDASGNVGLGTVAPTQKLTIAGGNIQLTSFGQINFFDANYFIRASSGLEIQSLDFTRFLTNGANERMRITNAGSVGIGTSSPQQRFVVSNAGAAGLEVDPSGIESGPFLQGYNRSTAAYTPLTTISSTVAFRTGSSPTERMRIDSSGNVGIGTSTPANKFEVFGNGTRNTARASSTADTAFLEVQASDYWSLPSYTGTNLTQYGSTTSGTTGGISNAGLGVLTFQNATAGLIRTNGASPLVFATTNAERMRITSTGNVGIGTSSPAQKLHVASDGYNLRTSNSGNSAGYNIGRNTTDGLLYFYGDQSGANGYAFSGVDGERMRIDSSGNLLVGTTTSWPGDARFEGRKADGAGWGVSAYKTADVNTAGGALLCRVDNTASSLVAFYSSATPVGAITTNGTTTTYATTSDYRLKENVVPMQNALATVQQLKPVTYSWKADGSSGQGFIAHELQAAVPDCVTGEKDAVDAEGKPVYQGIDTSFLVATLTAAIQELKAELDSVKSELAILKGN